MPFRHKARLTVTNEGKQDCPRFYSNIDYMIVPQLPPEFLCFHAQYRQSAPCVASTGDATKVNLGGRDNYVYVETRGRGHLDGRDTRGAQPAPQGTRADLRTRGAGDPCPESLGKQQGEVIYMPLAPDSSWQKFAFEYGGNVFIGKDETKAMGKERARLKWEGKPDHLAHRTGLTPYYREDRKDAVSLLDGYLPSDRSCRHSH